MSLIFHLPEEPSPLLRQWCQWLQATLGPHCRAAHGLDLVCLVSLVDHVPTGPLDIHVELLHGSMHIGHYHYHPRSEPTYRGSVNNNCMLIRSTLVADLQHETNKLGLLQLATTTISASPSSSPCKGQTNEIGAANVFVPM
jgi:hypothetical protein